MKKSRLFMMAGALCAALGLGSCNNEMEEVTVPADGATRTVTLTVSLPDRGADTRTAYAVDGTGLKVTWANGDKLTAMCEDITKSTTFTLESMSEDGKTATFTGELPEDVTDGEEVYFFYPTLKTEEIAGKTHYFMFDYRTQDGTLAGLSKVDFIWINADYSKGKLTMDSSEHDPYFLHFAKGTKIADAGGTATFVISKSHSAADFNNLQKPILGDIKVSDVKVDAEGKLSDDVYIAFNRASDTPTLAVTVNSDTKIYSLDKEFTRGTMYNISDMSQLTEVTTPPN